MADPSTLDIIKSQIRDMKETGEYALGMRDRENYKPMGNFIKTMTPNNLDPGDDFATRFGEWANGNVDWRTGKLLTQDPRTAIDSFIKRGIPPPDVHAPSRAQPYSAEGEGMLPGSTIDYPIVRDPKQGNLTSDEPIVPKRVPIESITPTVPPLTAPTSPLDPEEAAVPLPAERPASAPGSTDVSAKKKDVGGAFSDFSKSLQGVKALQPPSVNAVGTPSVRSPSAVSAPNLQQLAMMGAM
jgi:hypothetical protein